MKTLSLVIALAASALAADAAHANVPDAIKVPAGHKQFAAGHAIGVQIYACDGQSWSFVAPRANLYNERGKLKMTHFAGPTWQHKDGSQVVGQLAAPPSPVDGAIPWLLLSAKSTAAGPFGDRLASTTFIQRVNTTGGLAPDASTCNASTAGTQAEVPYTADYYFWKAHRQLRDAVG